MKFSILAAPLALASFAAAQSSSAAAPSASASSAAGGNSTDFASGLLAALNAANLTTLSSLAVANAATLLPLLQQGNVTVFAPNDAAFAALPAEVTSDSALVAQVLLYHIYPGSYNNLSTTHTIARSLLNSTDLVNLPGGQAQVGVLTSQQQGQVTVVQPLSNVTSVAAATYQNIQIYVVPEVLTVPTNVSSTATAAGLTSLVSALTTNAPSAVTALDTAPGVTIFAPINSAFDAAQGVISTLNMTTIGNVLLNHVINGTVLYSSLISDGASVTTAGGSTISVIANSTGVFVRGANTTARVIQTDVIVENGVVHLIDQVLANTETNPTVAASAASSAAAATSTATAVATGPVTATGSSPSGSAAPASGAEKLVGSAVIALLAGGMAALM